MTVEEIYQRTKEHFLSGNYKVFYVKDKRVDKREQKPLNEVDADKATAEFLLYLYLKTSSEQDDVDWQKNTVLMPRMNLSFFEGMDFDELISKFIPVKNENIELIRDARRKQSAEVFTPDTLVNEMLEKLPLEVWVENKTFCDPACGNGNFLIWILIKKIAKGHSSLDALKSIYGVDIMTNNIRECRRRLLKTASIFEEITEEHAMAVLQNIVKADALVYDFEFDHRPRDKRVVRRLMNYVKEGYFFNNLHLNSDDASIPQIRTRKT